MWRCNLLAVALLGLALPAQAEDPPPQPYATPPGALSVLSADEIQALSRAQAELFGFGVQLQRAQALDQLCRLPTAPTHLCPAPVPVIPIAPPTEDLPPLLEGGSPQVWEIAGAKGNLRAVLLWPGNGRLPVTVGSKLPNGGKVVSIAPGEVVVENAKGKSSIMTLAR